MGEDFEQFYSAHLHSRTIQIYACIVEPHSSDDVLKPNVVAANNQAKVVITVG